MEVSSLALGADLFWLGEIHMRLDVALLLALAFGTGCAEQSGCTSRVAESVERPAGEIDVQVSLDLTSPQEQFKATWDSGGAVAPAFVPLCLHLRSKSGDELSFANATLVLDALAENSQRQATKSFSIDDIVTMSKNDTSIVMTVEAGEFLTDLASGYMKGDTLEVKADIAIPSADGNSRHIESNTLKVRVFVPEG